MREREKRKITSIIIKHTLHSQAHTQVGALVCIHPPKTPLVCIHPPKTHIVGLSLGLVLVGLNLRMYFGLFSNENQKEKRRRKTKKRCCSKEKTLKKIIIKK